MLQYILKEITKLKPAVEWYFFLATLSCLSAIVYIKPVITFSVGLDFDSYYYALFSFECIIALGGPDTCLVVVTPQYKTCCNLIVY